MIVKISKKVFIHSFIYFIIYALNKYINNIINYEYISYIYSLIIIVIFSESHILNIDLKHLQDKYDKISNDYSKFIIETNKKNNIINDIIRENSSIMTDVKIQLIEIKNELYFVKSKKSSPSLKSISPIIKSFEVSNYQIPKLNRGLDNKSCIF